MTGEPKCSTEREKLQKKKCTMISEALRKLVLCSLSEAVFETVSCLRDPRSAIPCEETYLNFITMHRILGRTNFSETPGSFSVTIDSCQ